MLGNGCLQLQAAVTHAAMSESKTSSPYLIEESKYAAAGAKTVHLQYLSLHANKCVCNSSQLRCPLGLNKCKHSF